MKDITELHYTLPLAHAQIVMDALADMPWKLADPVIRSMRAQADQQILAANDEPKEE